MASNPVTWQDEGGYFHAIANDPLDAAKAIRQELLALDLIGKFTPVSVEAGRFENEYVEVWS